MVFNFQPDILKYILMEYYVGIYYFEGYFSRGYFCKLIAYYSFVLPLHGDFGGWIRLLNNYKKVKSSHIFYTDEKWHEKKRKHLGTTHLAQERLVNAKLKVDSRNLVMEMRVLKMK